QIDWCYTHELGPGTPLPQEGDRDVVGLVSPHAGYMFSGPVAAHGFGRLGGPGLRDRTVAIIGPNHTGIGAPVSLLGEDFKTPLGVARVDMDSVHGLVEAGVTEDAGAHRFEHSVEVQIPFLQHLTLEFRFVPIVMMAQDLRVAQDLGRTLREVLPDDTLYVASTDFSHYIPPEVARAADSMAIERILEMDAEGLFTTVTEKRISMCGFGPVMAMLIAVGDAEATLLKYATSGDIRPMHDVVGYASIVLGRR
ncbi:MAG TPA: AmmeMemoRadiSam system protein B, partial [Thermoplasmata archaeon]|nr:AmmeMemoRadiSam system protein B [Thermoplasmata archaeon]